MGAPVHRLKFVQCSAYFGVDVGVDPLAGAEEGPDCAPAFAGFLVATSDFAASASAGGLPALLPNAADADEAAGFAAVCATAAEARSSEIESAEQATERCLVNVISVSEVVRFGSAPLIAPPIGLQPATA